MNHLIPKTFSHNEMNPLSSIFSGSEAKSTCSNWYELLAKVLSAYLHLSLSMKPSLLRSKRTKMLLIYYRLKIPVLNPVFSKRNTLFLFEFESFDEEFVNVLRLFVAEVRAEVFEEFDDSMFSEVLVGLVLERVIVSGGHKYLMKRNSIIMKVINLNVTIN